MLMNDYFRKLGMGGHFSSSPFTKADETPTYGKRWLEDLSQPLCPKNCHFGVTADDVVAYAEKMHVSPLFRFNPQSLTTEFEHSLATHQSDWSAKLAEVATLLSQHGADARPMAVHQLAESLLTVIQFSGHVQRHQAVIDADSHAGDLDIRSRHTLEGVTETMARWESIAAQWVDGAIATALGSPLSSCELGVVADVIAAEGAPKAASTLYRRAEERALTQSDRFYYHAMALTTRLDPSTYWLSDGARVEAMSLYNDIAVALKSGSNVAEMVDGGGQAQPVGNVDQLYVAEAIAGRLYFDLVSDELSREQDSERIASRQHTLEGLEATLRERLSTRAHVASLPESIHALEFAASVANRYIQPGGVISSAHETRSEAITQVLASVAQLTSLGEQFGPTDSVSTAVLSEFKAQLAWMGNVESYRRASLPWEALHRIKSVLEPRYAATETYKSLLMALYRQAPQHFDAQMHFNPRDVATNEEGVKAGLSEFSQSLNSSASPWRRFFVDSGTTLAGAGAGFLLGNLPGAAIGAVVGGGSGEVGNVGLNALEDRQYIHQAARAGITDVTPEMVKASSLFWGGSLVVSSALRAFGGYGLGSMAVKRFGTSFAVRNALQFAIDNPAATLQAARAGIPGAIFGTSEVGRSFYRNYWFRLGMMAVGVDAVGLHRQANGHIELRSDWVPDTWVGYAGIGLMLLSPQSLAVLTTEGRSYLARWWTTEMVRYPGALTRATVAAARGLLSETPALTQSWTLTQWRDGLLGVIQSMPQLANRPMAQWSLGEWWDVGTQLRSVQSGTSVEEILIKESADFQTFSSRLAPWDRAMGEGYWWDGWRHARLSNMNFPESTQSLYKLAFSSTSNAAKAAGSTLPTTIRRGMDMVFGTFNAVADRITRWEIRNPVWESGRGFRGLLETFHWETPTNAEIGWDRSMGFFQSARYGKIYAWLNGRFDAAGQAVRATVPEFFDVLRTPMIAKETDVSAQMIGRKGFSDIMEKVFTSWSETRTEKYPTLALLIECSKSLMSAEFIRAHRLGGLVTAWDKLSDGKLNTWSGFFTEMAMWNYVTELLGFSTTAASDIGTSIFVFTQAQMRKSSGEALLDQDPNSLRAAFYQFHAGFFYMRLVSGIHAPGLRFLDGLPFVRDTFPSLSSVPPALRVGVELERVNFRTPLGYLWSVAVPPASMGIALGDVFRSEKFADASGYYGTRSLLKFIFSALILNPRQVRQGYITALATLEARFWGYLADLSLNKFADSFIGKQLFKKVVTGMLESDDPKALDAVWDKFCETNTTLSVGGVLSEHEKEETSVDHPLQFGYRWEPIGLDAWVEWDHDRTKQSDDPKKDKRGYLEKLADDRPQALQRLVDAYRQQMYACTASFRQTSVLNETPLEEFSKASRDAKGMVVFAMMAKYYAWKASRGQKGWVPFVQLVNEPQYRTFWDAIPELHSRKDINHHVELMMNDKKMEWKRMLVPLHATH